MSKYDKKLAIIVPYRNRSEHLGQFVPHIRRYFQRDKLDKQIAYEVHIIEQQGTDRMNVGKLKNCGFHIARDRADYFCFHDVDYLPIWADYSYCERPARLIWHGLTLKEDYDNFFGAVVMLNKEDLVKTNGYSNNYWGWGPEDLELRIRCHLAGLELDRRDGTYTPLPHKHNGFDSPGMWTEEAVATHASWEKKRDALPQTYLKDGINSLEYELIESVDVNVDGTRLEQFKLHRVRV